MHTQCVPQWSRIPLTACIVGSSRRRCSGHLFTLPPLKKHMLFLAKTQSRGLKETIESYLKDPAVLTWCPVKARWEVSGRHTLTVSTAVSVSGGDFMIHIFCKAFPLRNLQYLSFTQTCHKSYVTRVCGLVQLCLVFSASVSRAPLCTCLLTLHFCG